MRHIFIIAFLLSAVGLCAQKDVTTFGIQIKPILPIQVFVDGPYEFDSTFTDTSFMSGSVPINYSGTMVSTTGYSFGMVIRHGFTKTLSLETGINYVRRNYKLTMSRTDTTATTDATEFGFVSYSIPVQGLVYVRLSEMLYMNASTGVSLDGYASGTTTLGQEGKMQQLSWPHTRIGASYIANLGFELRTSKDGYFYIGASYQQPFGLMAVTRTTWRANDDYPRFDRHYFLNGQYLTLDLRYFFHEDPNKKIKKKKSTE